MSSHGDRFQPSLARCKVTGIAPTGEIISISRTSGTHRGCVQNPDRTWPYTACHSWCLSTGLAELHTIFQWCMSAYVDGTYFVAQEYLVHSIHYVPQCARLCDMEHHFGISVSRWICGPRKWPYGCAAPMEVWGRSRCMTARNHPKGRRRIPRTTAPTTVSPRATMKASVACCSVVAGLENHLEHKPAMQPPSYLQDSGPALLETRSAVSVTNWTPPSTRRSFQA